MPKRFYISMLSSYRVCQQSDCSMAVTCLHQTPYVAEWMHHMSFQDTPKNAKSTDDV